MRDDLLIAAAEEIAFRMRLYARSEDAKSEVAKGRRRDVLKAIDDLVKIY